VGTKACATYGADLWVSRIGDLIRLSQFTDGSGTAQFAAEAYGLPGWSIVVEQTDSLADPVSRQIESAAVINNPELGRFEVQVPRPGATELDSFTTGFPSGDHDQLSSFNSQICTRI
jgi:hypothetical protein